MNSDTIIVEKMINGGYGLARKDDGQIVLLRNTLPAEHVHYAITEKRKNTLFGQAHIISNQHKNRVNPPCPYYGKCGGCDLQHCEYGMQLEIKQDVLFELFSKISAQVQPVIPSPQVFGYRQRVRLHIKDQKRGFLRYRSADIIPIKRCLLAHPTINDVFENVMAGEEFSRLCNNSLMVEFLLNPLTEEITLLYHYKRKPRPSDRISAAKLCEKTPSLERIFFQGSNFPLQGPYTDPGKPSTSNIFEQIIELQEPASLLKLCWEVGGFCQVNLQQNSNLQKHVQQLCLSEKTGDVLDLFCGMGNFSIPLAKNVNSLTGVEGQGSSIRSAKQNCAREDIANANFIKGPINNVCKDFIKEDRKFNVTILDPPRQGVPELASILAKITLDKIIYISCDPATLARDAMNLARHHFTPSSIQPFDMFPQTHHIETVVVFEKN